MWEIIHPNIRGEWVEYKMRKNCSIKKEKYLSVELLIIMMYIRLSSITIPARERFGLLEDTLDHQNSSEGWEAVEEEDDFLLSADWKTHDSHEGGEESEVDLDRWVGECLLSGDVKARRAVRLHPTHARESLSICGRYPTRNRIGAFTYGRNSMRTCTQFNSSSD